MGKITNLVFEGGGIKGLAYVGAIRELAAQGHLKTVKHLAGASAGAITAAFLGLSYSVDDVEKRMPDDFTEFQDGRPTRLVHSWGMHPADKFYNWLGNAIAEKLGNAKATFADLHAKVLAQGEFEADVCFRDVHLMGSNLSTQQGEVFSYYTTPNMPIVDAVRVSMSFPLAFDAKIYKKDEHGRFLINEKGLVEDKMGDMYVDGGLAMNYPVSLFDVGFTNPETLGFRVDDAAEIAQFKEGKPPKHKVIKKWGQYGAVLVSTAMWAQYVPAINNFRTVYIDTGKIDTLQFKLTPDEKKYLIDNGMAALKKFTAERQSGQIKHHPEILDTLRAQKRDRERLLIKADSIYFKFGQPVLQMIFDLPAAKTSWAWEEKISKYADWLNRHWGILSVKHHKKVGGEQQVITVHLDSELQRQVEKFLQQHPSKNPQNQLLNTKGLVLLFERSEHVRPSWMVDLQIKPEQKAKLSSLVAADAIGEVMQLIQADVPLDTHDNEGNTLLHTAARIGSSRLVRLLLSRQLSANAVNNFGDVALHFAVQSNALANDPGALIVKQLCERGADIDSKNKNGSTPLLEAAASGNIEAIKALLSYGADINHQNARGLSALMLAAAHGQKAAVEYLLSQQADPDLTDKDGYTARSKAENKGHADIVPLLPVNTQLGAGLRM